MTCKGAVAALAFPWICLGVWVIWLSIGFVSGKEVVVVVGGYDPRDLLSGRYIQYQIDWNETDCAQFPSGVCPKEEFCGVCRFYVSEARAGELDELLRFGERRFEVVYSYRPEEEPVAKRLLIDGMEWRQVVSQSVPEPR